MDDIDNKMDEHDAIEESSGRKNIGKAKEKLREKRKS